MDIGAKTMTESNPIPTQLPTNPTKMPFTGFDNLPLHSSFPNEPDWKSWHGQNVLLFDRTHRSKVELTGPHAAKFLHNLCSNDIKELPLGGGCEVFFSDKSARYISFANIYHFLLSDGRHAFWLDLSPGTGLSMIGHLDRHLVSEQVELADRTNEFAQFHLCGDNATHLLGQAIQEPVPELGQHQHMVRSIQGNIPTSIRRHDLLGFIGYELIVLKGRATSLWEALVSFGALPTGEAAFQGLRVLAGFPEEPLELDATIRVMEVDRPKTAIADNKGCYLGQEPIVMARDRGQLNRKLRKVKIRANSLSSGPISQDGKEIGRICSCVEITPGNWQALAYLRRGFWDQGSKWECQSLEGPIYLDVA